MRFQALELSIEVIRSLRGPLRRLQARDGKLGSQLRDAASSVALNLAEGNRRAGGDRVHLWRVASGSAEEVRTALRVAAARGHLDENTVADVLQRIDHLQAMLWKLTR